MLQGALKRKNNNLKSKVDINLQDKKGRNTLMHALEREYGDVEQTENFITRLLQVWPKKSTINVNLKDVHDRSALSIAFSLPGHGKIVKLLKENGAEETYRTLFEKIEDFIKRYFQLIATVIVVLGGLLGLRPILIGQKIKKYGKQIRDQNPLVRKQAIKYLGLIENLRASCFIIETLEDSNIEVRLEAGKALINLEKSDAIPEGVKFEMEAERGIRQQLEPEKYVLIKDEHILKAAQCLKKNREFELKKYSSPEQIEIIDL